MSDQKICPTCGTEYPLSERFCPRDGTALRSSNAQGDLLGSVVAERYHIIKKLGEGGMGTVYLAEHVKMGRKAALKVMNPGMHSDSDAIARFNREAANASRLNHPNVCGIYDFGETPEGLIYLAMEFIEGSSLTAIIEKNGSLPAPRAASIIHQAADALAVAHDAGIVHRDLKPDNIMIAKGRDGSDLVKVVDFGIAKASNSDAQKVTKTGLVVGTPEYMSPEQLAGDTLDGRSDIYSLGLVAFNCLTGKLPFPSNSAQEAMIMRLTDLPKRLDEMRPDISWPDALQRVMDKALARDSAERYQSAAEFGRDIAKAVERMPAAVAAADGTLIMGAAGGAAKTVAAAAVPATRVASPAAAPAAAAGGAVVPAKKSPVAMIAGGVAVVGIALVAYLKFGGGGGAATTPPAPDGQPAVTAPVTAPPTSDPVRPAPIQGSGGTTQLKTPVNPPANDVRKDATKAADPAPPAGATVASIIAKYDQLLVAGATPSNARPALADLEDALKRAAGSERGNIHALRAGFLDVLDGRDKDACDAARQAVSEKANGDFGTMARNYLDANKATCK